MVVWTISICCVSQLRRSAQSAELACKDLADTTALVDSGSVFASRRPAYTVHIYSAESTS
jgi:hypothetical protein